MKRSVLQSTENCSPIVKSRLDVRQNGRVPSTKFSQRKGWYYNVNFTCGGNHLKRVTVEFLASFSQQSSIPSWWSFTHGQTIDDSKVPHLNALNKCTSTSNHPLAVHFVQLRVRSRADNNLLTMVFSRPTSLPIPTTWHRFSVCNTNLVVQDLTDDLLEPAVQLLAKYFTADEPPCKYIEVQKHPVALAELEKLWRNTIKDKLSVVCVKEDDPSEIIGVNVLTVVDSTDKDEAFKSEDAVWWQLFGAVEAVSRSVDVFRVFSVDRYLTAYGLVVAPAWRGRGVAGEILRARVPLCKALGVKVTATVFTAAASQAVAKKAGFQELYKISYEELSEKGFTFPGIEADTKYSKLMALEI